MRKSSRAALLSIGLACLACGGGGGGGGFTGTPAELLPNLRPEPASDLSISTEDIGTGVHRILRLASRVSNYGIGAMEIYGEIQGANHGDHVLASQIIRWNNGARTVLPAGDFEFHDVHSHWHWENLVRFKLLQAVNTADPYDPGNAELGTTPKVSFCLLDTSKIPGFTGPNQPASKRYKSCGTNTQGISVGWYDLYAAGLYGQWIVIDGLADGLYWITQETDPDGFLKESDETDNRSAVKVQITGNTVTVVP